MNCLYCRNRGDGYTCEKCVAWNHYEDNRDSSKVLPKLDIRKEMELLNLLPNISPIAKCTLVNLDIKKVIFNYPATVVLWEDGTKTVVKCGDHDVFDPEKGLAMAIAKKALGNRGNYFEVFKKWVPTDVFVTGTTTTTYSTPKVCSVREYCEKHHCTRNKVYQMIDNRELRAAKDDKGRWFIYEENDESACCANCWYGDRSSCIDAIECRLNEFTHTRDYICDCWKKKGE